MVFSLYRNSIIYRPDDQILSVAARNVNAHFILDHRDSLLPLKPFASMHPAVEENGNKQPDSIVCGWKVDKEK